jgi:hypothetical protein
VPEPLLTIQYDKAALAEVQGILRDIPSAMGQVFSRAINRTASSARVRIAREISSGMRLGVRKVQSRINLQRATRTKWQGSLGLSWYPFDLAQDFNAKASKTSGVRVTVLRGQVVSLPRAFIPKADIEARREGHEFLIKHGLKPATKKFRFWWGYNAVIMRYPKSRELVNWRHVPTGPLFGRIPMTKVRGPSLAELWQGAPDMVANMEQYSQHTLEENVEDQVNLVLRRHLR